jgi:hypothetical protein
MNDNETLMDQSQLANDVSAKIPYEFADMFLVKPLDKIMVKKEVTTLPDNKPVKDSDGIEATEGEPKTEVKEVESDYKKGVILKLPASYHPETNESQQRLQQYKVGDVIVYKHGNTMGFDLVRDSRLIKSYNIIAIAH